MLSSVPAEKMMLTTEDVRKFVDGTAKDVREGSDGAADGVAEPADAAAGDVGRSADGAAGDVIRSADVPLVNSAGSVEPEPADVSSSANEPPRRAQACAPTGLSSGLSSGRPSGVRILKDVTGNSTCVGRIEDFVNFFNDRMTRLKRILRNRRELNGAITVSAIKARRHEREVKVIAMVADVHKTPNGRVLADIEDETGTFRILLPAEEKPPINLMRDEVVGVIGKLSTDGDIIWVQSIIRPDIPLSREPRRAEEPVCAAFIGDIHLGSKTFLEDEWRRFVSWLNGRENRHQDFARRIEYLVVSGDVVDGIGIYPDQEEDLAIKDVYRQYQVLADMLKDVPDRIKVLMLPGNHDAVRPAEPQPTFPPEITKLFDSRIAFIGNPCHFTLEGVEVLAYHGMSIADFTSTIPHLSFNTPLEVMKEMLRRRHLAPVYGDKTPLAPEARDWMVIDSIPDIFVTGHVHASGMENYRGVVLINSSTWQSQTDYQRMMNFQPQPSRVAVVDLHSLDWRMVSFNGQG
jgi:DNA polymerase II small subunit